MRTKIMSKGIVIIGGTLVDFQTSPARGEEFGKLEYVGTVQFPKGKIIVHENKIFDRQGNSAPYKGTPAFNVGDTVSVIRFHDSNLVGLVVDDDHEY